MTEFKYGNAGDTTTPEPAAGSRPSTAAGHCDFEYFTAKEELDRALRGIQGGRIMQRSPSFLFHRTFML